MAIHAAVGAAAAAAGGGNALQGAGGAAAGEAVTPYLESYGASGELAGTTLVGALFGGGAGASTALAGTQYNYLDHLQMAQEAAAKAACKNQQCVDNVTAQYNALSYTQDLNMANGLIESSNLPSSLVAALNSTQPNAPAFTALFNQALSYQNPSSPSTTLNYTLVNQQDGQPLMSATPGVSADPEQRRYPSSESWTVAVFTAP
ncbi:MAG TPA: hypothetical protein VME63_04345 [Dyella sp.]|uniref:hypothetical protein n=1 Tax=Dyella sp. TaxID=1869338 RepID=UPI002B96481F|nr:hypothetical protein [Dyella sp.]HTV84609.1 hypothetical protein [Dyella sp.]